MTVEIKNIYESSHQALALGQKGILGGMIGTAISSASGVAVGIALAACLVLGSGATGIGAGAAYYIFGTAGLLLGATRYVVYYSSKDHLDTTAKKLLGLGGEFFASMAVFRLILTNTTPAPLCAALACSAVIFPLSVLSNIIIGQTFLGIKSGIQYCQTYLRDRQNNALLGQLFNNYAKSRNHNTL